MTKSLNSLTAVSSVDGRYGHKTGDLRRYFSEYALIHYRVKIEVEYFIALCRLPLPQLATVDPALFPKLRENFEDFSEEDALEVKKIEKVTNHDVKAVEYFLKEKLTGLGLEDYVEFIHFGLTSQDINNTATPLMLKEGMNEVIYPAMDVVLALLKSRAEQWKDIPMLARTHGQPAAPTRLGKELQVFVKQLENQLALVAQVP